MKLLIYSDLHLDHQPFMADQDNGERVDRYADLVVLAGDIDEGTKGVSWARETFPDKPILYVADNHEYYGQHWTQLLDALREAANTYDVNFMEADHVDIGGIRFLGCTLWTDFGLLGPGTATESMRRAHFGMADYRSIRVTRTPETQGFGDCLLAPELTQVRHFGSMQWLQSELATCDPTKTVVITHHAPLGRAILRAYVGHHLSPAYASDLSALMGRAALWIHGHIHDPVDYEVGGTRIISNPLGYMRKKGHKDNPKFRHEGIWDV